MRLLIISPTYFPSFYPRAFRWTALSEHYASKGILVDVITSRVPGLPNTETIKGVNVFRVSYASLEQLLLLSSNNSPNNKQNSKSGLYSKAKSFLQKSLKNIWRSIYWPDAAIIWFPSARRKALYLLKKHRYSALITVSNPFTAHLIGLSCKKYYPELDWIVDIGDPFYLLKELPLNNFNLYGRLNRFVEEKVLFVASRVACTVEETKRIYGEEFPSAQAKITVIPPLLTPTHTKTQKSYFPKGQIIKISYIGGFYKAIREPTKFLQLLRLIAETKPEIIRRFKVFFFGSTSQDIYEIFDDFNDIKGIFDLMGGVPREDITDVISNSDLLINIANTTGYQLPSKSVDYMQSGKPIINVCHSEDDSFKKFFEQYPICYNIIIKDTPSIEHAKTFVKILDSAPGLKIDQDQINKVTKKFTVESISAMYLNLIHGSYGK